MLLLGTLDDLRSSFLKGTVSTWASLVMRRVNWEAPNMVHVVPCQTRQKTTTINNPQIISVSTNIPPIIHSSSLHIIPWPWLLPGDAWWWLFRPCHPTFNSANQLLSATCGDVGNGHTPEEIKTWQWHPCGIIGIFSSDEGYGNYFKH